MCVLVISVKVKVAWRATSQYDRVSLSKGKRTHVQSPRIIPLKASSNLFSGPPDEFTIFSILLFLLL